MLRQTEIETLNKYRALLLQRAKDCGLDADESIRIAECIIIVHPEFQHEIYAIALALSIMSNGGLKNFRDLDGNVPQKIQTIKDVYASKFSK